MLEAAFFFEKHNVVCFRIQSIQSAGTVVWKYSLRPRRLPTNRPFRWFTHRCCCLIAVLWLCSKKKHHETDLVVTPSRSNYAIHSNETKCRLPRMVLPREISIFYCWVYMSFVDIIAGKINICIIILCVNVNQFNLQSGGADGSLFVSDCKDENCQVMLDGHCNCIVGISFSPDGNLMATLDINGKLIIRLTTVSISINL